MSRNRSSVSNRSRPQLADAREVGPQRRSGAKMGRGEARVHGSSYSPCRSTRAHLRRPVRAAAMSRTQSAASKYSSPSATVRRIVRTRVEVDWQPVEIMGPSSNDVLAAGCLIRLMCMRLPRSTYSAPAVRASASSRLRVSSDSGERSAFPSRRAAGDDDRAGRGSAAPAGLRVADRVEPQLDEAVATGSRRRRRLMDVRNGGCYMQASCSWNSHIKPLQPAG